MKSAAALLLPLLLALCAGQAAAEPAAVVPPAASPAPTPVPVPVPAVPAPTDEAAAAAEPPAAAPAAAPFLWQIKVGEVTHYLLGSVHLLPKLAHPLPVALEKAYASADTLVFESDLGALDAPEMQKDVLAAARGKGLREEIPPAMYARVQAHARDYGLPENVCDPYAAWFCAMTLEIFSFQRQGFDASFGLDQHFYARAVTDNKTVAWFEAPAEHMKLFTAMSPELGRAFLAATLDEDGDPQQQPAALLKAWQSGDTAFVEQLDLDMKRDYPALYERLLGARNRIWLPNLAARLKLPESQMIIVGTAHLVGPDGLVPALRLRGFDVRRVDAPPHAAEIRPPLPAAAALPAAPGEARPGDKPKPSMPAAGATPPSP